MWAQHKDCAALCRARCCALPCQMLLCRARWWRVPCLCVLPSAWQPRRAKRVRDSARRPEAPSASADLHCVARFERRSLSKVVGRAAFNSTFKLRRQRLLAKVQVLQVMNKRSQAPRGGSSPHRAQHHKSTPCFTPRGLTLSFVFDRYPPRLVNQLHESFGSSPLPAWSLQLERAEVDAAACRTSLDSPSCLC